MSFEDRYRRTTHSQYIKNKQCENLVSEDFIYNIECLDKHDFSNFITEGRSLVNLVETIENEYDRRFKDIYGIYMFDNLEIDDIADYFSSRYTIQFQPYIDWVVRKEDGPYSETRRRVENCS